MSAWPQNQLLPLLGMNGATDYAIPEIGMVWSQTRPGPVSVVLNRPSPPNSLFLRPGTC